MKIKIIVLLLIFGVVLLSGCAEDEQPSPDENDTPVETETPEENVTAVETETPEENVTAVETETPEENVTAVETETPEESETEKTGGVITPGTKPTTYTIRLDNNRASRSNLEIKQGDTIAWLNWEDSPRRTFTLVSEENLFDNTNLAYKRPFAYTFNETGEYHFSVVGQPRMNVTVSVVEP
ncbi:MAG: hypothetical protein ACOX7X_01195 [Methanosarcina flavescens]|jgi:plastocyanin|uniref:Cell surface lipoprotein n=1 Tax=Methanosarcina flavescens TaxID=1715806 RepID=A0A660HV13_9EURY|nr:hypothetical protein [Methanosarcina flavescens]AYK16133.1 hypothetical protein AOB57_013875 [Methanosarcina flavescens]NLK32282.1 hypothetical protein [Methanosarcina flavescens]